MNKKSFILPAIVVLAIGGYFLWKHRAALPAMAPFGGSPSSAASSVQDSDTAQTAFAPIIVYKTTKDYSDNVAVQLSTDGTQVIAYPGPSDAALQHPAALDNGYYIGEMPGAGYPNGAFLDLTIENYAAMAPSAVTTAFLLSHVADRNPFTEIYNCSLATTTATMVSDINNWIDTGQLATKCQQVL